MSPECECPHWRHRGWQGTRLVAMLNRSPNRIRMCNRGWRRQHRTTPWRGWPPAWPRFGGRSLSVSKLPRYTAAAVSRFGGGTLARWLGHLFATRPRRHSSATPTPGLELLHIAPRHAPVVAPGQAPGEAPAVKAPCPMSMLAPRAAPLATPRQPSNCSEVRRIFKSPAKPSAQDHARQLLEYLQGEPSLVGHLVPASELEWAYVLLCDMRKCQELPWQRVAAQLNRLTGGERSYRRVDGRNVRVYYIPTPFA